MVASVKTQVENDINKLFDLQIQTIDVSDQDVFTLKFSEQRSEKMPPLSFLSVPIYSVLSFSKSAKWTRISWVVLSIWVSILASIPSTSNGSWINSLQVIRLCLHFVSVWYGWNVIVNDKKRPDCLWPTVRRSLILVFLPYSSRRPKYFKVKTAWSYTSMVWHRKSKSLLSPFSTWVLTGAPISTKRAHRAPTFVVQSPHPLEIDRTVEIYNLCFSFV